jgi:hypothetical protein
MSRLVALTGLWLAAAVASASAQQAPAFLTPNPGPPLFFREAWRQTGTFEAPDFRPQHPVTAAAVSHPSLVLTVHDPGAANIKGYAASLPARSAARDWRGPSCVQMSGYAQDPPPQRVVAGEPTDPPNLWTGVCMTPVAVTLRHATQYVNLTGLARIKWVTRVSGFHVVRPVVRLADGTWLVGDYAEGAAASNSTAFLETEFPLAALRWLRLDMDRVVTTGTWIEKPDLSRVDEVGFADLLPGSGHGWGGFVNVGRIEIYGAPVAR